MKNYRGTLFYLLGLFLVGTAVAIDLDGLLGFGVGVLVGFAVIHLGFLAGRKWVEVGGDNVIE